MTVARPKKTPTERLMSTSKTFGSLLKAAVLKGQGQPTTKPKLNDRDIPILEKGTRGIIELTLMKTSVNLTKAQANLASAQPFISKIKDPGINNNAKNQNVSLSKEVNSTDENSKTSLADINATGKEITVAATAKFVSPGHVGDAKLEEKIDKNIDTLKKKIANLPEKAAELEKATELHVRTVYNAQPTETQRRELEIHKEQTQQAFQGSSH